MCFQGCELADSESDLIYPRRRTYIQPWKYMWVLKYWLFHIWRTFLPLDWIFDHMAMLDIVTVCVNGKRIKAGMNEGKSHYCKHAIHCLNLVYHRRFLSPRRCYTDARGMLFNIYPHCPLLTVTLPGRLIWCPWNNSNVGSTTPTLMLLSMGNLSATSRIFQCLKAVDKHSTESSRFSTANERVSWARYEWAFKISGKAFRGSGDLCVEIEKRCIRKTWNCLNFT